MFKFKNTKAFKSICLILASSILCMSCHTTQCFPLQDEYNTQLNGKTYAEVVELIGPPDRTISDGKDGEILIYEVRTQQGSQHYGRYSSSINLTEKKTQTSVYLDANKKCYKVKSDDVRCEKVFSLGKTLGLVIPLSVAGLIILISAASEEDSTY